MASPAGAIRATGSRPSSAHRLDAFVWERVKAILTNSDRIARELERMQEHDPSEADLSSIDRALVSIEQQRANIVRAIDR